VQEFANGVVYVVKGVCDEENVPHPNIVTESGRYMTAYHTVFITSIRDEIETFAEDQPEITIDADDPQVITELKELCDTINGKNYAECYHDALELKDELHTQFNLGLISLEDRAIRGSPVLGGLRASSRRIRGRELSRRGVRKPEEDPGSEVLMQLLSVSLSPR